MRRTLKQNELFPLFDSHTLSTPLQEAWSAFSVYVTPESEVSLFGGPVSPKTLADIYTTRARVARQRGLDTGGFEETVRALRQESAPVHILVVDTDPYYGFCFTSANLDRLVGFLYVPRTPDSPPISFWDDGCDRNLLGDEVPSQPE